MSERANILVVEDDESMRDACSQVLRKDGHTVTEASTGHEGMTILGKSIFDLVILDVKMPGPSGMEILSWMRAECADTPVIIITGYATVDLAVAAMKGGAVDFLAKPFSPDVLRHAVSRNIEVRRLTRENALLKNEIETHIDSREFVGESEPIQLIMDLIRRVGPTDSTVLITGESGTGKEVVARKLREYSLRRDKPFVVVDCGALVGALFESELFGHVKGSFTGATGTKHGRLELASGGTIFFDEVGNIGPDIQSKLLRVIQERELTLVGSNRVFPVDVRIIAATSKNLLEEIQTGRFREDLYYRLCVVPIVLPPLRQRTDDILPLAHHFLGKSNRKCHKKIRGFSDAALNAFMQHSWPGNVRELENIVERAVVLATQDSIEPKDLLWIDPTNRGAKHDNGAGVVVLRDIEREHVSRVLEECGGNRTVAARKLGIDRKTLWRKLREG